jgi:hypothetical protein
MRCDEVEAPELLALGDCLDYLETCQKILMGGIELCVHTAAILRNLEDISSWDEGTRKVQVDVKLKPNIFGRVVVVSGVYLINGYIVY